MPVYIATVKMSSGGPATGKSWTHTYGVTSDQVLTSDTLQDLCETHVTTLWKPLYPNNVYFDSMTLSDLTKNEAGETPTAFRVFPLSIIGQRTGIDADNDRTALETCLTINAYSQGGRPSKFWLRGALLESEVGFNPGGGWTYIAPGVASHASVLAGINFGELPLQPGKVNMKTREESSFHAWTEVKIGAVRARQTTARKKVAPPHNESSALKRFEGLLPIAASVLAFVLTKGRANISLPTRTNIIGLAGTLGTIITSAIEAVTDPAP